MAGKVTRRVSARLQRDIQRTQFERVLGNAAQIAMVLVGVVVVLVAVQAAQVILAPVSLAIIIGLMFGPVADIFERRGVPQPVSAGIVVLGFLLLLLGAAVLFYLPLSEWAARIPQIWSRLQGEIANWRESLASLGALQEQIDNIFGQSTAMEVQVADGGSAVTDAALMAPAIGAQVLIFLISLYFFLATRDNIRVSTLSLCYSRRMRWRVAHAFRDVERQVSQYLITISMVNLGVGAVVTLATWAIGMPSPLLWGALAAVLNYIPFVGQALMAAILFVAGLGTGAGLGAGLLPVGIYWAINFVEGNFVTPNLLGRTMTINPFMIFLSLTFWIWAWGPVGGLVAVPSLLILYSVIGHILPSQTIKPRNERVKLARKADVDTAESAPRAMPAQPEGAAAAR
jgi:predicted PurR-regulated permease PerM